MTTQKARLESERSKRLQSYQKKPQPFAAVIICGFLFILGLAVGYQIGAIKRVEPKSKPLPIQAQPATKGDIERLEGIVTSQTAPLQQINAVPRIRLLSQRFPDRGGSWVDRVDKALERTPMAGQGRAFVIAAADSGLPPNLSVAIALHESGAGRFTPPGSHNPYGMTGPTSSDFWDVPGKGPDGTRSYQAYPDWETAIRYHARFIVATWGPVSSPYQMKGYAESSSWSAGVANRMESI